MGFEPPLKSKEMLEFSRRTRSSLSHTLKWINSFLCFRKQPVVVNGIKSDWAPVFLGVPQGTVLGPLLFHLYINDISSDIESEIRLFADACVCYREIKDKKKTHNEISEGY